MKRIIFFLENSPDISVKREFEEWTLENEVVTSFYSAIDVDVIKPEQDGILYITDSPICYAKLCMAGLDALIAIDNASDTEFFQNAKYFVLDVWDADFDYFDKVFRRIHNIPWEIARTNRLTIRETVEDDVTDFIKIYSDREITRFTEGLYEESAERAYITEYRQKVYACQEFGIWTVINEHGSVIGRAGLSTREGIDGVEIGFLIGKEYQNKGYATEALQAILDYAKINSLDPINALVMPDNDKSRRLLKRLGFTCRDEVTVNGVLYDRWEYCQNA